MLGIVFDASITYHSQFLLFSYLFEEIVVIDEKWAGNKRIKGGAIAINVIFIVFIGDLRHKVRCWLFEAKLVFASNDISIHEAHVLFKKLRCRHGSKIIDN